MNKPVVIITGANRGIGRETALKLAKKDFIVVMACRNLSVSLPVRDELRLLTGNDQIDVIELNLGNLDSVRRFVEAFKAQYGKLNVLINNAGMLTFVHKKTKDGFEQTVGVNYFGPYLLTRLLLPLFQAGEDNRIINLTSVVYPLGCFNYVRINDYKGLKAYAVSKYLVLLFTLHLAEELKPIGICVNAVHPGVIRTNIFSTKNWYTLLINTVFRFFLTSVEKGAEPVIRLAVQTGLKTADGDYYQVFKLRKVSGKINSGAIRTNLIEQTDKRLF